MPERSIRPSVGAAAAAALMTLAAACGSQGGPQTGSETHFFLPCTADAACPGSLGCYCGVCTTPCAADAPCSAIEAEATCVAAAAFDPSGEMCGLSTVAICAPPCDVGGGCPAGATCSASGACTPLPRDTDAQGEDAEAPGDVTEGDGAGGDAVDADATDGGTSNGPATPFPILFVAQVPTATFGSNTSTVLQHETSLSLSPPGSDLWLRYPDGELRNLTAEAGLGTEGAQGAASIAVRDPAVSPSGTTALVSIATGAAEEQFETVPRRWQLYQVTGLGQGDVVSFEPIANQPAANNISPVFLTENTIAFVSDTPALGLAHHAPQWSTEELRTVPTGLFRLTIGEGSAELVTAAPSGLSAPTLFGDRIVVSRWDNLVRPNPTNPGLLLFESEEADASLVQMAAGPFPEPSTSADPDFSALEAPAYSLSAVNLWEVNPEGWGLRTLGGLGRHELGGSYCEGSIAGDPSLVPMIPQDPWLQPPLTGYPAITHPSAGSAGIWAVRSHMHDTESAGQIIHFGMAPGGTGAAVTVSAHTPTASGQVWGEEELPPEDYPGKFRSPIELADGRLLASHTPEARANLQEGTSEAPKPRYSFRLHLVEGNAGSAVATAPLLAEPITKAVSYWNPDVLVTYDGPLWELSPVEVRPRAEVVEVAPALAAPEAAAFAEAAVDANAVRTWLAERDLALVSSRNVTVRDASDRQQPFNLAVTSGVTTAGDDGAMYEVDRIQLFEASWVWGKQGTSGPEAGRGVKPIPQAHGWEWQPPGAGADSTMTIAPDGSFAAFVPARRPMTWQLLSPEGTPVVRERYWLSLSPGEIRGCSGCHDPTTTGQDGGPPPANTPQALVNLLVHWKSLPQD